MFATFGFLSAPELIIILVIALIIFGPGKLPELGKSLGKGITEFKEATKDKSTEKTETKDGQSEKPAD